MHCYISFVCTFFPIQPLFLLKNEWKKDSRTEQESKEHNRTCEVLYSLEPIGLSWTARHRVPLFLSRPAHARSPPGDFSRHQFSVPRRALLSPSIFGYRPSHRTRPCSSQPSAFSWAHRWVISVLASTWVTLIPSWTWSLEFKTNLFCCLLICNLAMYITARS